MHAYAASCRSALAAAAAMSLAFAGPAPAQETPGPLAGERYVALGDSFAAGSGSGPVKPDSPPRCARSFENYATLLASVLRMVLIDATCDGATAARVLGPWNELPAQLDAVNADTRLVTITVGGNDIGYVGYLMAQGCGIRGPVLPDGENAACPEAATPGDEGFAKLETDLRAVAAQVKSRAPRARLVFVQYPALVPVEPCAEVPLSQAAALAAREIARRLAQVIARIANDTGSDLLGIDMLAPANMPCGRQPWSAGWPADHKQGDAFPWHPTRAGHAAIASQLAARLGG